MTLGLGEDQLVLVTSEAKRSRKDGAGGCGGGLSLLATMVKLVVMEVQ